MCGVQILAGPGTISNISVNFLNSSSVQMAWTISPVSQPDQYRLFAYSHTDSSTTGLESGRTASTSAAAVLVMNKVSAPSPLSCIFACNFLRSPWFILNRFVHFGQRIQKKQQQQWIQIGSCTILHGQCIIAQLGQYNYHWTIYHWTIIYHWTMYHWTMYDCM